MTARASRQGFLGAKAQERFDAARLGIAGLGGGGSHIVQQTSHIGFKNFTIIDPDVVEDTNLNRLIGATERDVREATSKVLVARRMINGLASDATVAALRGRWQEHSLALRNCDIIFACLDSYAARQEMEAFARRYLIPVIDIGMDVHTKSGVAPAMSGQVILSLPGEPCMECIGFLNAETLKKEAAKYGDVGIHPQVVWANGVLASAAVGIAVDLLTDWTGERSRTVYLEYDGNKNTLLPHKRLQFAPRACRHYPSDAVESIGDPIFIEL